MTTFPAILQNSSPTPIGRKPGFLSRGTSLLEINLSSDVVLFRNLISLMKKCLMKLAITLRRSYVQLPNIFDVNILLPQSASIPNGSDQPLVLIAAFRTNSSFMSSKITG